MLLLFAFEIYWSLHCQYIQSSIILKDFGIELASTRNHLLHKEWQSRTYRTWSAPLRSCTERENVDWKFARQPGKRLQESFNQKPTRVASVPSPSCPWATYSWPRQWINRPVVSFQRDDDDDEYTFDPQPAFHVINSTHSLMSSVGSPPATKRWKVRNSS